MQLWECHSAITPYQEVPTNTHFLIAESKIFILEKRESGCTGKATLYSLIIPITQTDVKVYIKLFSLKHVSGCMCTWTCQKTKQLKEKPKTSAGIAC